MLYYASTRKDGMLFCFEIREHKARQTDALRDTKFDKSWNSLSGQGRTITTLPHCLAKMLPSSHVSVLPSSVKGGNQAQGLMFNNVLFNFPTLCFLFLKFAPSKKSKKQKETNKRERKKKKKKKKEEQAIDFSQEAADSHGIRLFVSSGS